MSTLEHSGQEVANSNEPPSHGIQLILLAQSWGPKNGGINAFNTDFAKALGRQLGPGQVVCVTLNRTDEEQRDAADSNVELLAIEPGQDQFSPGLAHAVLAELKNKSVATGPGTFWIGHDVHTGPVAIQTANAAGHGRSVVIQHMSYGDYISFRDGIGQKALEKQRRQEELYRQADVVFAVGPLLRDRLKEIVHDQGKSAHMIVPGLADIQPSDAPRAVFRAVAMGRLGPADDRIKQGRLAVAAVASAIREAHENPAWPEGLKKAEMWLYGIDQPGGAEEAGLRKLARETAGRGVNLVPLPFTHDRPRLLRELSHCDAALMLSWHEGFGLTGWEAIAAGVPLIVSENSGLYQLIDESLGAAGLALLEHQHIRGWDDPEGDENFHDDDVRDVRQHLLGLAKNRDKAKTNALQLRQILLSKDYTWGNAAASFLNDLQNNNEEIGKSGHGGPPVPLVVPEQKVTTETALPRLNSEVHSQPATANPENLIVNDLADVHPYIASLKINSDERYQRLYNKLQRWQLNHSEFYGRLGRWLSNFDELSDRDLALSLLLDLDFYSETRFEEALTDRLASLKRKEIHVSGPKKNAFVVLPPNPVDSAARHGWLISKIGGLAGSEVQRFDQLSAKSIGDHFLVFINDTHGSGDQFIREIWTKLESMGVRAGRVVVVGIAIAQKAHDRFQQAGFVVIPADAASGADAKFNQGKFDRLRILGLKLEPKHPLGYGSTALLVAYHFQCPNNTLPVIWSPGREDFPWNPLFEYRGKTYGVKATATVFQTSEAAPISPGSTPKASEPDPEQAQVAQELKQTARRLIVAILEGSDAAAKEMARRLKMSYENSEAFRDEMAERIMGEPLSNLFDRAIRGERALLGNGDRKAADAIKGLIQSILPARHESPDIVSVRAHRCGGASGPVQLMAGHRTIAEIIMAATDRRPTWLVLDDGDYYPRGKARLAQHSGLLETGRDAVANQFERDVTEELLRALEPLIGTKWKGRGHKDFPTTHKELQTCLSEKGETWFRETVQTLVKTEANAHAWNLPHEECEFTYYFLVGTPTGTTEDQLNQQNAALQRLHRDLFPDIACLRLSPDNDYNHSDMDPYDELYYLLNPTEVPR